MRTKLFIIACLAYSQMAIGQMANQLAPTELPIAPHPIQEVFSFDIDGGLIFVQGDLEGKEGMFVLDTGAPTLILNSSFVVSNLDGIQAMGISGTADIQALKIDQFRFGNVQMDDLKSYVTNLSHIEKVKKRRIKGLIGYELVKDKEILIDYVQESLAFLDPDGSFDHFQNKQVVDKIDFSLRGHFPVVRVKIGKRHYYFGIDTGAEANIISKRLKKKVRKSCDKEYVPMALQGIDANQAQAESSKIKSFKIDGIVFNEQQFVFTDISYLNKGYQIQLDGILGAPFLKTHCFSLNYKDQELKIWKSKAKQESFLVQRTREVVKRKN